MHSKRKARRNVYRWVAAGPLLALLAVLLWAWPYMAITEPSGAKVLVVEGWMDPPALEEAARMALDSGYSKVYTTGTVRPFAHYLGPGEAVVTRMAMPAKGNLAVDVSGIDGAGFLLIADNDTVLDQAVTAEPTLYHAVAPHPVDSLRIQAWPMHSRVTGPEIFVRILEVGGWNVNVLQRDSRYIHADGKAEPAPSTFAHSAMDALVRMGVPADRITAVPAYGDPRSRSWGNAHAFGIQAAKDGITAFDVATTGVHARRSRNLFRLACGEQTNVGVIALTDPYCTRSNWWKSRRGWGTLLKEVFGAGEAQAVEVKKWR